jgi:hypothetical protein
MQTVTFIRVFLKSSVICLTSLLQYVKVAHFVMWCMGSLCMFCFCSCGGGFSVRFVLHSLFLMCFKCFLSFNYWIYV